MVRKALPDDLSNEVIGDPEEYLRHNPRLREDLKRLFQTVGKRFQDRADYPEGVPRILGDFRVIREIASGGMGTVFEAEQISLKRRVALKLLPSHLRFSGKAVQKFQREAEAGGRQNHPGIVVIYAVGEHHDVHYIAEELVEGGVTLADWLEERKEEETLPRGFYRKVAELFVEIADALHHAHESGVIHRDVKPSNILLTPDLKPKVTDFGLARVEGGLVLSATGDFFGTAFYTSPEQALGKRSSIDHRADIFSLGVSLYESLTLKRPFDGSTSHLTLQKIVHNEPSDPRQVNARIPRDLAIICLKALEKDPGRRYATMDDFREDLRRYLDGEAIVARPAGPVYRFWRRMRRSPAVSILAGLAILILFTLIAYVLWSYPRILTERDKAVRAQEAAEKEAEKANAVNRFMQGMFASPDPGKDGRNVKVAEVLDKAAARAGGELSGQPEIEAMLRGTLGETYYNLGLYEEAEEQFRVQGEILLSTFGMDHWMTLSAMNSLATTLGERGQLNEAAALHRKTLERRKRLLGEDHEDILRSKHNLATVLIYQGRLSEAVDLHREVLSVRRRILGNENKETLTSMNNLSSALYNLGEMVEAEALAREAVEIQERVFGDEHPDNVTYLLNLGGLLSDQLKFLEAFSVICKAVETSRRLFGEDHTETSKARFQLASLYTNVGFYSKAESIYRKIWKSQRETLGRNHLETILPAVNLCLVLKRQEKFSEAEAIIREEIEIADRILPEHHPMRSTVHMMYGDLLREEKRYEEAEPHLLEAYAGYKATLGIEKMRTQNVIWSLMHLYKDWGRQEESEAYRALLLTQ